MDNITIKLPQTGYTVELKPFISTKVYRGYQRTLFGDAGVDITKIDSSNKGALDGQEIKVNMGNILEGQDFILSQILVNIKNGEETLSNDVVSDLPTKDGNLIYAEVDKLLTQAGKDKEQKKGG